jgi:hypothetical protein
MKISFISIFFLLVASLASYAQKKFNAAGEAQMKVENNVSKDEIRQKVKDLAIINAIENELGTYVEQESNIDIQDGKTSFNIIGNSRVKGEWLETKKEEFIEDTRIVEGSYGKETEVWLTCKISGIVREIIKPKLAFEYQALNCPEIHCRQNRFNNGESLYIFFKSPSSGFLSIYLTDDEVAYRILPYSEMSAYYLDAVPVNADKDYIFFSSEADYFSNFPPELTDQLELTTEQDIEYMRLIIVFSTEPFSKPILNQKIGTLPKSVPINKFNEWIRDNRIYNLSFNYQDVNISIVK